VSAIRRKLSRKGDRPIDFLKCRVVIFFVYVFVQVELFDCDLVAARNPELLSRGLRLVVEIACDGAQRRIQPHGLLEPGGTCVETSDDVIAIILRNSAAGCQAFKVGKSAILSQK
jgi:hypothetical protein